MSQYNKLYDFQYARLQILPDDLHCGLFGLGGIPTMCLGMNDVDQSNHVF